jgi:phosphopantetheinyl transferase (holo-ACP synthase)
VRLTLSITCVLTDNQFSDHEWQVIRCTESKSAIRRMYQYWALKEAYVKATGQGIAVGPPLAQVVFDYDPSITQSTDSANTRPITLHVQGQLMKHWYFMVHTVDVQHDMALACFTSVSPDVVLSQLSKPSTVITHTQLDAWLKMHGLPSHNVADSGDQA